MYEYFFQCLYCWEGISILIDVSLTSQSYIEDCEICCNPIQVSVIVKNREIVSFQAESIE